MSLTQKETEVLEMLNTDHHKRMADMHTDYVKVGKADELVNLFIQSGNSLLDAMLGAEARYTMRGNGIREALELGAGTDRDRQLIEQRLGASYTGVEIVRAAAERLPDVHYMAFEQAPPAWNGRFQYIFSRHVMEHVVDPNRALAAVKRLLAPNGVVGAITPHFFPDLEPAHLTKLNLQQWISAYRRAGLKVVYATEKFFFCEEAHLVAVHEEWPTDGR